MKLLKVTVMPIPDAPTEGDAFVVEGQWRNPETMRLMILRLSAAVEGEAAELVKEMAEGRIFEAIADDWFQDAG